MHDYSLQMEAENVSLVLQDNGIDAKVVLFVDFHKSPWSYIQWCNIGNVIILE